MYNETGKKYKTISDNIGNVEGFGADFFVVSCGAWYHLYDANANYEMLYETRKTDVYTMVITFPSIYADDETYANYIECIEVILESKQML